MIKSGSYMPPIFQYQVDSFSPQSSSIPPLSGLAKQRRYWKTAVKGVKYINKKKRIWDLKISGGIRGKAVNGGAVLGPGGEAVDGGVVLGGTV